MNEPNASPEEIAIGALSTCLPPVFKKLISPLALVSGLTFFLFGLEFPLIAAELGAWLGLAGAGAGAVGTFFNLGECLQNYASSHGGGPNHLSVPIPGLRSATSQTASTPSHPPLISATPEKLGLLEFDTYNPSDIADWLRLFAGAPASVASNVTEVPVNGGVNTPGAGETEVLLDIDTALSLGTNSSTSYVVYDAPPSTSFEEVFNAMIGDGDTVISNSWSQCEDETPLSEAQAINSVLAEAAASGISVFNGTGDQGSTCLDGSPDTIGVPADSPNATAVGGTTPSYGADFGVDSESWWNGTSETPPTGQGGYGVSRYFARPSYQNGFTTSSMRSVPDVAVDADPSSGIEFCQADNGGCPDGKLVGGTSMTAPEMAAMTVTLNQNLGYNIGNFNAAVYPNAGAPRIHLQRLPIWEAISHTLASERRTGIISNWH